MMDNGKRQAHLGDVSVFDQNDRICSFSGFASPVDILNAWGNAANPREWYETYKDVMFENGMAVSLVSAPGGVDLSSYTPWSIIQRQMMNEQGERKLQWKNLGWQMLSSLTANDCQGIRFGNGDPKAALISLPSLVGYLPKLRMAYEEHHGIPMSSTTRFKPRRVVRLFPVHFLLQEPWGLYGEEWDWLEKNPTRETQFTLDLDGCREERLNFINIFRHWGAVEDTADMRRSVLRVMPYVQNEFKGVSLDEKETRAALFLVKSWAKRAPVDASKLLMEFKKMELSPAACADYESTISPLIARWERKKLAKIVQRPAVKASLVKGQNHAL